MPGRIDTAELNPATIAYIETIQRRPQTFSAIVAELKLTENEKEKFKDFQDFVTYEMADIPVTLYGRVYDFKSLQKMLEEADEEGALDPYRFPFDWGDIHPPSHELIEKFDKKIEKIKADREKNTAEHSKKRRHSGEGDKKHKKQKNIGFFAQPSVAPQPSSFRQFATAMLSRLSGW